jgi:cytochrome b561
MFEVHTPANRYTTTAIVFHWVVAVLMIVNVALAWSWPYVADESVRPLIDNHKSIGVTVLGLAILRLLWRATHRPPAYPAGYKGWERTVSHLVHGLLYAIIFVMPLTGWIMDSAWKDAATHPMHWFGLFEWPRLAFVQNLDPATRERMHGLFGGAHELSAKALYVLVFLHIAGALKHQWLDGDRELQRMWPGR